MDDFVMISPDVATNLPTLSDQDSPQQLQRFERFLNYTQQQIDSYNISEWEKGLIPGNVPTDEYVKSQQFLDKVKQQIKDYEDKKNK